MIWDALTLQLGYNATLVTIGAALLGMAAGATGTFLFLGKRALVSDAISHATLPGVALAFVVMVALGGDGRPAGSAGRLGPVGGRRAFVRQCPDQQDAAVGGCGHRAVLSVFFGFGIVLLTVIQSMNSGRQAGLESFLLGSTAGMLWQDAMVIASGGAIVLLLVAAFRRADDHGGLDRVFAASLGINVPRVELAMMGLALAITVVGLKVVGLILIVALLIIPAVAARFWTDRVGHVVISAGLIGAASGYAGAAVSATAPALPTGPIIVLVAFALFILSLLTAPNRGVFAVVLRHRRFRARVHVRQGLLALAQGQPIYEGLTLRLLRRRGLIRADGVATELGRNQAGKALRDERRWQLLRSDPAYEEAAASYDGLTPLDDVLTPDQLGALDRELQPKGVF